MSERRVVKADSGSHAIVREFTPQDVTKMVKGASPHLYFHLAVKCALFLLCCILVFVGVKSGYDDVCAEKNKIIAAQAAEIKKCGKDYTENKCEQNDRPGLIDYCQERKECMERNPEGIPTLKIVARYSATLLNEFMNILSPQTVAVIALVGIIVMFYQK